MPGKVVPRGMMQDFKMELRTLKTSESVSNARQKVWMHMATRFGRAYMQTNEAAIRAELAAAVKEVQGG